MEKAYAKFAEAAHIRAQIANKEAAMWSIIGEALELMEGRQDFGQWKTESQNPAEPPRAKNPTYMYAKDAAEYLGVSEGTLAKWRLTGGGPKFVKVGSRVRYNVKELDGFMEENTFPHTSAYR